MSHLRPGLKSKCNQNIPLRSSPSGLRNHLGVCQPQRWICAKPYLDEPSMKPGFFSPKQPSYSTRSFFWIACKEPNSNSPGNEALPDGNVQSLRIATRYTWPSHHKSNIHESRESDGKSVIRVEASALFQKNTKRETLVHWTWLSRCLPVLLSLQKKTQEKRALKLGHCKTPIKNVARRWTFPASIAGSRIDQFTWSSVSSQADAKQSHL